MMVNGTLRIFSIALTSGALLVAGQALAAPAKPAAFAQCAICHQSTKDTPSGMGPNLWNVSNRTPGTLAGYTYSSAMKNAGGRWTRDRLIAFVSNPAKTVPGTKMSFMGLRDPKAAADVATYVLSLK